MFLPGGEISRQRHFPLQETQGDHGIQEGDVISGPSRRLAVVVFYTLWMFRGVALPQHMIQPDEEKDSTQVENFVAQCYIESPYLINGEQHNSVSPWF